VSCLTHARTRLGSAASCALRPSPAYLPCLCHTGEPEDVPDSPAAVLKTPLLLQPGPRALVARLNESNQLKGVV
jgi:hypothetical protein